MPWASSAARPNACMYSPKAKSSSRARRSRFSRRANIPAHGNCWRKRLCNRPVAVWIVHCETRRGWLHFFTDTHVFIGYLPEGLGMSDREQMRSRLKKDGIEYILVQFVDIHGAAKVKM